MGSFPAYFGSNIVNFYILKIERYLNYEWVNLQIVSLINNVFLFFF